MPKMTRAIEMTRRNEKAKSTNRGKSKKPIAERKQNAIKNNNPTRNAFIASFRSFCAFAQLLGTFHLGTLHISIPSLFASWVLLPSYPAPRLLSLGIAKSAHGPERNEGETSPNFPSFFLALTIIDIVYNHLQLAL